MVKLRCAQCVCRHFTQENTVYLSMSNDDESFIESKKTLKILEVVYLDKHRVEEVPCHFLNLALHLKA
jgi:hypothetical protein